MNKLLIISSLCALMLIAAASQATTVAASGAQQDAQPEAPPSNQSIEQQSAENQIADNEFSVELDNAASKGLAWLASVQNADGSFTGGGRYGRHVGITALACLAFMADGHVPGRGVYGDVVSKGLDFIIANVTETGLLAADTSHGPMYGHGFATLFLGEVYGMTAGGPDTAQASRVYEALLKAIRLIVQTQNKEGGWRYNPVPYDADISVTICQIMALRSARNAGVDVPKASIDHAVDYVRRCQNPDGGFKYQLTTGGSAWPRSAAGVASLYYAGVYKDKAIDEGLGYLLRTAMPGEHGRQGAHYFYGHYYAVQAMYLAGGEYWRKWWPAIRQELIESQRLDGAWDDPHAGRAYGTAMALIILQMPKRYLPIFQK